MARAVRKKSKSDHTSTFCPKRALMNRYSLSMSPRFCMCFSSLLCKRERGTVAQISLIIKGQRYIVSALAIQRWQYYAGS